MKSFFERVFIGLYEVFYREKRVINRFKVACL
jgi:hypothetical protein